MGDNIYLGDRDGVRTPMQWSPDRNGGFSKADPARLFLPAIQDPIYGFDAVNVEAQMRAPASLLNWMRRMIAIRRNHQALGRGALHFLYPANRKVLAYVREYEGERVLCVANVSRAPQAVQLDLSDFNGCTLLEMTGGTYFPPIGDLPYLLTLPAYGFYWFQLTSTPASEQRFGPRPQPELFTLVLTGGPETLFKGREGLAFQDTAAPRFIAAQRWFAGKGTRIRTTRLVDYAIMPAERRTDAFLLPAVEVELQSGERQTYSVPLVIEEGVDEDELLPYALARVRRGRHTGLLYGAASSQRFALAVVEAMRRGERIKTSEGGTITFSATSLMPEEVEIEPAEVQRLSSEQSNTSILLGEKMVMKLYRRLQPGAHPEVEMGRFLTEVAGFRNTPPTLGFVEHEAADGTPRALAVLQQFVRNQGDAWTLTLDSLRRELDTLALLPESEMPPLEEVFGSYMHYASVLGQRTGELHRALATPTNDSAFAIEPLTLQDVRAVADDARAWAERAFRALGAGRSKAANGAVETLLSRRDECLAVIDALVQEPTGAIKSRVHGDYHLGQVLIVQKDVMIVDFEGEPSRPAEARRAKSSPLRDVAGMLRSFAYAAETGVREVANRFAEKEALATAATARWRMLAEAAFLSAYEEAAHGSPAWVEDAATRARLLRLHLLSKALYEIDYEANNRPEWIETPIRGVLSILDEKVEA
jgi:maltose alpha-D-glucosyltransferase/alpha-amylase